MAPHVEPVVAELMAARHVAGRVELRQPGETGTDATADVEARDRLVGQRTVALALLDLVDGQHPGTDEAHVALPDVDELRALVERRRAHEPTDARDAAISSGGLHGAIGRMHAHAPELAHA